MDFDRLSENVREQDVAIGVVATPVHGNGSVVFHHGGIARHRDDPLRGIEYVETAGLAAEHILASAAIPALFPAVRVTMPEQAAGWYFDGGPRLNTPIKPALWLGAERVIVIALNAVSASRAAPPDSQPDFYAGAAHLLHAALGDPLAQDIRTLANRNALIAAGLAAGMEPLAPARLRAGRANSSPGPWTSRSTLCLSSSSRPRIPRRSARSPNASTASTTGAPGRRARAIYGCWERSSTAAPTPCMGDS